MHRTRGCGRRRRPADRHLAHHHPVRERGPPNQPLNGQASRRSHFEAVWAEDDAQAEDARPGGGAVAPARGGIRGWWAVERVAASTGTGRALAAAAPAWAQGRRSRVASAARSGRLGRLVRRAGDDPARARHTCRADRAVRRPRDPIRILAHPDRCPLVLPRARHRSGGDAGTLGILGGDVLLQLRVRERAAGRRREGCGAFA